MKDNKEQYFDAKNQVLYTFGEYTIEVDFVAIDKDTENFPFARPKILNPKEGMKPEDFNKPVFVVR